MNRLLAGAIALLGAGALASVFVQVRDLLKDLSAARTAAP